VKLFDLDLEKIDKLGILQPAKLLGKIFEQGTRQGVIREIDPYILIASFFGTTNHTMFLSRTSKREFPLEKSMKTAMDIFIRGIKTG